MTVRRRVQLLFVPFMVLLLVDIALDRNFIHRRDESRELIARSLDPARVAVSDLLQALVDQQTGQRGYIITGQAEFLHRYEEGGNRADTYISELARVLEDEALKAAVERVRSRVAAWRQLGAEFEIEAKRAGRDTEAGVLVSTGTGTRLFDRARTEVADLQQAVRTELADEERRLASLIDQSARVRQANVVIALGFVAAATYLLVRWVVDPVQALVSSVRRVAAGDVDRPIPSPGPPDLSGLGRDIEAMRVAVLAAAEDANRAREALGRQGMIVLTLGEELAPSSVELPPGLAITFRFRPAEGVVAGDWFDVVRAGDDQLLLVLVDVSGHGEAAALFALKTKHLMLAALRNGLSPGQSLRWLANQLGDTGDRFLTAVIVEIDASSGQCRYANAGHPPMLLRHPGGITQLGPTGPMLGPLDGEWAEASAVLPAGGLLVMYSDGLVESRDGSRELGVDGLCRVLESLDPGDVNSAADACIDVASGAHANEQVDDLTLVVLGTASPPMSQARPLPNREAAAPTAG